MAWEEPILKRKVLPIFYLAILFCFRELNTSFYFILYSIQMYLFEKEVSAIM